jgi:Tol biopolymer transport system component
MISTSSSRRCKELHVVNADGRRRRLLTRDAWHPLVWSPDGRKIAFDSLRDGNAEIYVMNADGSDQRRLTRTPARGDLGLAWSPGQKN